MEKVILTGREMDVMNVLWKLGTGTVAEVQKGLHDPLAYTTVLTVMQNLERGGWLRHRRAGRRYLYFAAIPRTRALHDAASDFMADSEDDAVEFARHVLRCHAQRHRPMSMLDRVSRRKMVS